MTLRVQNVSYSYQQTFKVLSHLNIDLKKGEFVSLIGKSGTGKSTILKLVAGLLSPDDGEISMNGQAISPGDVGYMPQRDLLLPWRTILDNIMLATELKHKSPLPKELARDWLDRVGLLKYEHALPQQLSGGMRQRAAFLRALLTGNDVLLLDEPFGALDAFTKQEMQSWLLSIWHELDKTVLFITHDLEEACLLSDRIVLLHPDQTVEEIPVCLPRPRSSELLYSAELLSLRRKVEKKITYGTC